MNKELKIDEPSFLFLLNKALRHKEEERDMALDRYRKADENMQTNEHFMLLGKNAASFLNIASTTTNDIIGLMKEIGKIVYKENAPSAENNSDKSDDEMRRLIDMIKKEELDSDQGVDFGI